MPKKSLASTIAELISPTPKDFDPESFSEFGEKPKVVEFEEEETSSEENEIKKKSGKNVNKVESKRLFLKSDISLTEGKYAGKASSRKQFFNEQKDTKFEEEEKEDGDSDIEEEEEEEDGEEEEELEDEEDKREEEMNDSEDDSDDSDDDDDEEDDFEARYGNVGEYEKELKEIENLKKEQSIKLLSQTNEEKEKSQHTKNQKFIWNNVLKFRIKQQKLLSLANKMPTYDLFPEFMNDNEKNQSIQNDVSNSLKDIISSFIELGTTLKENNPQSQSYLYKHDVPPTTGKKRSRYQWNSNDDDDGNGDDELDRIWDYIQHYEESYSPFVEMVVDHWNKKTQLSSRISMTKFKAINQNILSQVRAVMEDSEKLIKRTQATKVDQKILGFDSQLPEYLPEIFDDTTFYQQLLKELIEGEASSNEIDITRSWLSTKEANKKRKLVDRKASKGRRLRYNVHDKLVNFTAPTEREPASYANDLFLQLFTK